MLVAVRLPNGKNTLVNVFVGSLVMDETVVGYRIGLTCGSGKCGYDSSE